MYPYTTPKSAKPDQKEDEDGVLNLLNIPEGVNIDNLSKASNGNLYNTEDFITKPTSSSKPNDPPGLKAPSVYKDIQRTTADKDNSVEESTTNTEATSTEGEKLNGTVQNDKTTIVPYNLNDDDSDIEYEVDVSEVELLKTTEKPKNDKENEVEDKRNKKKSNQDKDRKQRNKKKGRKNSSKYCNIFFFNMSYCMQINISEFSFIKIISKLSLLKMDMME